MHHGPLWQIWLFAKGRCAEWSRTLKIGDDFHVMGRSAKFGYTLWAIARFGYALWAIAQITINTAQNCKTVFWKLAVSFKGTVMLKRVCIYTVLTKAYIYHPSFLIPSNCQQQFFSPRWPIVHNKIWILITRWFESEFEKNLWNRGPNGVDWWKSSLNRILSLIQYRRWLFRVPHKRTGR